MMIVAKARLLVVALVLIALCDAAAMSNLEGETFVAIFNLVRMVIAKKAHIANMHALSWDQKLSDEIGQGAKMLKDMNCDFEALSAKYSKKEEEKEEVPGRFAFFFKADELMQKIAMKAKEQLDAGEWPEKMLQMLGWELIMHPLQTTVGCAKVDCPLKIPGTDVSLKWELFCLMGPEKTFEISDFEEGEAGSGCDKEDHGLCVESGKKAKIDEKLKEDDAMAKFGAKGDLGLDVAKLKQKSGGSKISIASPIAFALIVLAYLAF